MTRTVALMGTFVTIQVVDDNRDPDAAVEIAERVKRVCGGFAGRAPLHATDREKKGCS